MTRSSWHRTQDSEYLQLQRSRIESETILTWVDQVVALVSTHLTDPALSVIDYGCAAGHLAKGITGRGLTWDYLGVDASEEYLEIARETFRQCAFQLMDLEDSTQLRQLPACDVAVCSATLEHLDDPTPLWNHIFESTRRLVVIRTFMDSEPGRDLAVKAGAQCPYVIRQFASAELDAPTGWTRRVTTDRATGSEPRELPGLETPIVRTMWLLSYERSGAIADGRTRGAETSAERERRSACS